MALFMNEEDMNRMLGDAKTAQEEYSAKAWVTVSGIIHFGESTEELRNVYSYVGMTENSLVLCLTASDNIDEVTHVYRILFQEMVYVKVGFSLVPKQKRITILDSADSRIVMDLNCFNGGCQIPDQAGNARRIVDRLRAFG